MAGRGYMITAAYNSYNNGAVSPDDEEHSRLGYAEYECVGDVCRPVSGNADRGNHPLAFLNSATPAKYVVNKTERVVERVRAPVVDYDNRFAARDYGTGDRSYNKPENYDVVDHDRKLSRNDYGDTKYKEKAYDDRKFPTSDNGGRRYQPETYEYDLDHDRPRKVEEFITKVQDDVAQPIVRYSVASKTKWPGSASPALTRRDSPTKFGLSFSSRKLEDNPSKNRTTRSENYPDNQTWKSDRIVEPTPASTGIRPTNLTRRDSPTKFGFSFSSRKLEDNPSKDRTTRSENYPDNQTWKSDRIVEPTPASTGIRPTNYMPTRVRLSGPLNQTADSKTNLSAATNDINIAMEYLMKAANPSTDLAAASTLPQRRSAVPPVLKTDSASDSSGSHYIEEKQGYSYFRSPYQKVPAERRYAATSK